MFLKADSIPGLEFASWGLLSFLVSVPRTELREDREAPLGPQARTSLSGAPAQLPMFLTAT